MSHLKLVYSRPKTYTPPPPLPPDQMHLTPVYQVRLTNDESWMNFLAGLGGTLVLSSVVGAVLFICL